MAELDMLSVAALIEELPEKGVRRDQVGTIVESLAPGLYEVEFSDDDGKTYASVALSADRVMRLHHEPKRHAGVTELRSFCKSYPPFPQ